MSAPLLQLEAATLDLGRQRFGPFTLRLRAGERAAILGPSGAGKSTLLKLMARDSRPDAGQLRLRGRPLADWPLAELSRQRAVLPQSGEVAFGLATELVVALGRVARARPRLAQLVEAAAEQAHASHLLGRRSTPCPGSRRASSWPGCSPSSGTRAKA
jgi:iron complex transport system ATP-binding protein